MSKRSSLPPNICFLCLSRERKIFHLPQKCKNLFGLITDWYPQTDAHVCWECRATLERLRRFKEQAKQAVCALERARTGLQPMDFRCLSSLCNMQIFVIDLEPNEYAMEELSDYTNECKVNTSEYFSDAHVESDNSIIKNETEEVIVSDVNNTEHNSDGDIENDNNINQKFKLEEVFVLGVDEMEDTKNDVLINDNKQVADYQDNSGFESTIIKSSLDIDTEHAYQRESEKINLPTAQLDVDAPSLSKAEEKRKGGDLKVENTWTIEKTQGLLLIQITPLQQKKLVDPIIQNDPSTANALIKKSCNLRRRPLVGLTDPMQQSNGTPGPPRVLKKPVSCRTNLGRRSRQMTPENLLVVKPRQRLVQRGKRYKCDRCDKMFATSGQKRKHARTHVKDFMCDQCAFRSPDMCGLRKHMLYHVDPIHRPHECQVCHKGFAEKSKLVAHIRIHTGERPFKCDVCDKTFAHKETLTCHIQTVHNGKPRVDKTKGKSRINYFRLQQTATSGRRGNTLPIHSKYKKLGSLKKGIDYKVIRDSELMIYECNVCKERFAALEAFYKHYKNAQQTIPCTKCNRKFKFQSLLADHIKVVHNGERPYLCNVCGMRVQNEQRLRVHMSSHSNEKPFKCDECSATFKYKCGVYNHKMIHKGDKPHQCNICGARFTYKGNLIGHMKVHTKERPFECDICSKKFPWTRNLKNHLKTHSKEHQ